MKKYILLSALMVFGLALFLGCASMTGKTAGKNIDDANINSGGLDHCVVIPCLQGNGW